MNQLNLPQSIDKTGIAYKTIEKMAANLSALGADFKILLSDGSAFGNLEVVIKKKSGRVYSVKKGTYSKIYNPLIDKIEVGHTVMVDCAFYGISSAEGFRSSFDSAMGKRFGSGSYKSQINETTGFVEMVRLFPTN